MIITMTIEQTDGHLAFFTVSLNHRKQIETISKAIEQIKQLQVA